jgi:hypothetical protein
MGGAYGTYGEKDKLGGRGPFGRPFHRWRIILKSLQKLGGGHGQD